MLEYFFAYEGSIPPEYATGFMTPAHITYILLVITAWIAIPLFYRKKDEKSRRRFLIACAIMLVQSEITVTIWLLSTGAYNVKDSLPIHLCGLMNIIIPYTIATRKKFWLNFIYAAGLVPAMFGIFTPDINEYPPISFQYIQATLGHAIICLIPIFFVVCEGFRPELKYIPRVTGLVAVLAALVYPINLLTGGNYFFIMRAPRNTPIEIFDRLVGWPWYIILILAFAAFLWFWFYLPFEIIRFRERCVTTGNEKISG